MGDVIVVAELTEGIAATLQLTVRTDRSATIGASTPAGLPQGIPTSLSLETYSSWQNPLM